MKVLVVGGGAREHAIAKARKRSGARIYSVMKNRNPGIYRISEEATILSENDISAVVSWAKGRVDIAFIGPEAPLEAGLVDALEDAGIPSVGPKKSAARIETSKEFMRNLMEKNGIEGSLNYRVVENPEEGREALEEIGDFVIKPIGLTGGKGAKVFGEHLKDMDEAVLYLKKIFEGYGGGKAVIEERLEGEEFTLQAFVDGKNLVPMPLVQDHKRAYEGDTGPNTGGMGSYSMENHMLPFVRGDEYERALGIMKKVVAAMEREGTPYRGILYGQFMLTSSGPKIIEFNARFGDPEAMNVLSLLETPLTEISERIVNGELKSAEFLKKATVCKYVVPEGYGIKSKADVLVEVDEKAIKDEGAELFYASVNDKGGEIYTTTSRTLAVLGMDDDIEKAEEMAERALSHVKGEVFSRHDIGKKELIEKRIKHMEELRRNPDRTR